MDVTYTMTDYAQAHDQLAKGAAELVAAGETLNPQLFVFYTKEEGTLTFTALPEAYLAMFFGGEFGKDLFSVFIRAMMLDHRMREAFAAQFGGPADFMVQVAEAWHARYTDGERADPNRVQPCEHPRRKECVMISVHTPHGSYITQHPIEDNPRRMVVREFLSDERGGPMLGLEGRMTIPPSSKGHTKQ